MKTTERTRRMSLRHLAASARDESGVLMMFVLMALLVIGAVTLTVIQLISADVAGSLRELQADQVFNIAQAGVHYAIGKLQLGTANSYAGETATITSGSTTLGTATIVVNCIDTGVAPPCSGTYAAYRRIISTGALSASGPSRTIVAIVQATQGGASAICGYASGVVGGGNNTIYANVGSNTTITLASGDNIKADTNTPPAFSGTATAVGAISCASSCASQVQGGASSGQPGPICPAMTVPTFSPGSTGLSVSAPGYLMNSITGYTWGNVSVAAGTCSGATPFVDLQIQADPSNPSAVTVVQVNTLTMGSCSRLVILGVGSVQLLIGKAAHNSLLVNANARFAVLPTDTLATPVPAPPSRFIVWDASIGNAGATTAVQFLNTGLVSATLFVPNGRAYSSGVANMKGAIWANQVSFNSGCTFYSDTSGIPSSFSTAYANFNNLRSWKDQ